MDKMKIQDNECLNRREMAEDFKRAMSGPQERKGNEAEEIDYSKLDEPQSHNWKNSTGNVKI